MNPWGHPIYSPVSISHLRVSLLILWNKKKMKEFLKMQRRKKKNDRHPFWILMTFSHRLAWILRAKEKKKVIGSSGIFVIFFFLLLLIYFFVFCFNILKAQKRISSRGEQKRFWMDLGKFVWGERYHHHLAFGTRTLAADVCCETREDIYRRRLPPTVPYPLDINAFHLSWRPTEGLLTTDLLFCQKIRNAPHPATEPTIKNIAHPSISVLPKDQRVKRKSTNHSLE